MKTIKIYGKNYCPFCDSAKKMCETLGADHKYYDASADENRMQELSELATKYNHFTVPLILIEDEFVGGFSELQQLAASGELQKKIGL
jgi:glutaredoxin